jgi:hypothetical protein
MAIMSCNGSLNADKPGAGQPEANIAWGKAAAGLRLGVAADRLNVTFTLENVSDKKIEILSHVAAQEKHLDWTTLRVTETGKRREIRFVDDRNRSGSIKVMLDPGGKVSHQMDVANWAGRTVNGARALAPGSHTASAVYAVSDASVWTGRIESGEISLVVPK